MGHDDADDDYQHDGANDKSYVEMILVPRATNKSDINIHGRRL